MAIYTRFGTEVEVIGYEENNEGGWLKVRFADGKEREYHISEFRADGGIDEIYAAVNAVRDN
jgi:hypothetical protein